MNISFGEPHKARAGSVAFEVYVDDDWIGRATNALTPNCPFRLDITEE